MSTWLLAGLGNPGPEYERTRHNVGFMIADELARRARASFSAPRGMRASVAETVISAAGVGVPPGERLVLVKPKTFMNESGQAVGKLVAFYKLAADHVVIVHDEIDLEFGQLRQRAEIAGEGIGLGRRPDADVGRNALEHLVAA